MRAVRTLAAWGLVLAAGLTCLAGHASRPPDHVGPAALQAVAHPLALVDGRLTGPGARWLGTAAARAQFLFIGEEHDTREIPTLLAALWPDLVAAGYGHVALEMGGWLAGQIDRVVRLGDREALTRFTEAATPRRPGVSVPPVSREDIAFYQALARPPRPAVADGAACVWGLDHEFKVAPLLQRLADLTPEVRSRHRIRESAERVARHEGAGRFDLRPLAADIHAAVEASGHRAERDDEVALLIDALSRRVQPDGREQPRAEVFRQQFLRQMHAAQAIGGRAPRVLLRFGGYHAKRGLMTDYGTSTLANFVAEYASMHEASMVNVLFVGCSLTSTDDWRAPRHHPRPCAPRERVWLAAFPPPMAGQWVLYDLSPLRAAAARGELDVAWELRELVTGFDAVVLLGPTRPAQMPPPR